MPAVLWRHGDPVFVEYTPGAAVTAGDVVIVNDTPRVAHRDIAAGEFASLAASGGVYEATVDVATPADKKVYWDPAAKVITATAGTLKAFGYTVTATVGALQTGLVRHDPAA